MPELHDLTSLSTAVEIPLHETGRKSREFLMSHAQENKRDGYMNVLV